MGGVEATCSATDLVLAAAAFVAVIRLHQIQTDKIEEKKRWVEFFALLSAACFTGFVIHGFIPQGIVRRIIWIFLFAALFEIGRKVYLIAMGEHYGLNRPTQFEKRAFLLIEVGLYLPAVIIPFINGSNTIVYYMIFASLVAANSITMFAVEAFKGNRTAQLFLSSLMFAIPAILFQFTKTGNFHFIWDFDHNGASHLCLIGSVIMIYLGAKNALSEEFAETELSKS